MSRETVQRYWIELGTLRECTEADNQVVFMGVERTVVLASDYDALRTQARELADAAKLFAEGWGYAGRQQAEAMDLIQQAQAVLDATTEGP